MPEWLEEAQRRLESGLDDVGDLDLSPADVELLLELARVAAESARRAAEEARAAAEDARAAAVEQRALMEEVRATMAAYEQALKREAPVREPRSRDGAR